MIRARFYTKSDDPRPVNWPIKHPYWVAGYGDECAVIVAYADSEAEVFEHWPEAYDLDISEVGGYIFTDRFQKPEWFKEQTK